MKAMQPREIEAYPALYSLPANMPSRIKLWFHNPLLLEEPSFAGGIVLTIPSMLQYPYNQDGSFSLRRPSWDLQRWAEADWSHRAGLFLRLTWPLIDEDWLIGCMAGHLPFNFTDQWFRITPTHVWLLHQPHPNPKVVLAKHVIARGELDPELA